MAELEHEQLHKDEHIETIDGFFQHMIDRLGLNCKAGDQKTIDKHQLENQC